MLPVGWKTFWDFIFYRLSQVSVEDLENTQPLNLQ
jgi:hypothetical protein